jgi:hypothetical protein
MWMISRTSLWFTAVLLACQGSGEPTAGESSAEKKPGGGAGASATDGKPTGTGGGTSGSGAQESDQDGSAGNGGEGATSAAGVGGMSSAGTGGTSSAGTGGTSGSGGGTSSAGTGGTSSAGVGGSATAGSGGAASFAECGNGRGACTPPDLMPPISPNLIAALPEDTCLDAALCVPREKLEDPSYLFPSCTTGGMMSLIEPSGACVPAYLVSEDTAALLGPLGSSPCADDEYCAPCTNPLDGAASTGACE